MIVRAFFCAAIAAAFFISAPASAKKYSPDQVKKYCNAVGGELLGFDEHGHYGCDAGGDHTMVLCNKSHECTLYPPQTARQRRRAERAVDARIHR